MNRRNLRSLKRKTEKKRVRFLILPPLFLVAACAAVFLLIRYSMHLKEIVFIGNSHLKNEELRALIKVREKDALFGVSGERIYRNLKQSPWIKDAVVRRELSGRMLVKVTEGVPIAILSLAGVPYLVDSDGAVLEQMRDGTVLFLPVIKEIDPRQNGEAYMEAVNFLNVLHSKKIPAYEGSLEITGQRPEELTLKVDNIDIKIGSGDYEKKLERLESIKDEIRKRNIAIGTIDLRFANKIIVRPAGAQEAEVRPASGDVPKEEAFPVQKEAAVRKR